MAPREKGMEESSHPMALYISVVPGFMSPEIFLRYAFLWLWVIGEQTFFYIKVVIVLDLQRTQDQFCSPRRLWTGLILYHSPNSGWGENYATTRLTSMDGVSPRGLQ